MTLAARHLIPERLDHLPPDDAGAVGSRRDLRRINRLMRQPAIVAGLLRRHLGRPPRRILELGAGDGATSLALARRLAPHWPGVTITLLDRFDLVTPATRAGFDALGWRVETVAADVLEWLDGRPGDRPEQRPETQACHPHRPVRPQGRAAPDLPPEGALAMPPAARAVSMLSSACNDRPPRRALQVRRCPPHPGSNESDGPRDAGDVVLANLFLHHFDADLPRLLAGVARLAPLFIATEPRRDRLSLAGSRLLGLIGVNAVTRHDAPASVRAGFAGDELTRLWLDRGSAGGGWTCEERRAAPFTHVFVARRTAAHA